MSIDVQTVFAQESVILNQIRVIPGPPRVISVIGEDFRSVDSVVINQVKSPDVVILSPTSLMAQVPDSVGQDRIVSVIVLSKKLTLSNRSLLKMQIGDTPGRTSGILRLIQLFIKVLFTTPGRDIFSPRIGGGALKDIGSTFGAGQGSDIVNGFVIAVDNTTRQITAIQSRDTSIPREERLLSADVLSASYNKSIGGIDVSVKISSQAGQEGIANVGL